MDHTVLNTRFLEYGDMGLARRAKGASLRGCDCRLGQQYLLRNAASRLSVASVCRRGVPRNTGPVTTPLAGRPEFGSLVRLAIGAGMLAALLVVSDGLNTAALGEAPDAREYHRGVIHSQAYLTEGKRELQRGNYPRAIRLLSAAIHNGGDAEAFKWRGRAYDLRGDRERAVADINYYISLNPSDPAGYCLRGDAANAAHHHDEALRDYHKALELVSAWDDAYVGRGIAYLGLERYQLAAQDFESVLKHDPGRSDALINLGVANMLEERPNKARRLFETALEVETDPGWTEKLRNWISALPEGPDADFGSDLLSLRNAFVSLRPHSETPVQRPPHETYGAAPGNTLPERSTVRGAMPGNQLSGTWQTTYMGAQITLEVNQVGSGIAGVMHITGLGGKSDVYHFTGTVGYDGSIRARHHSGHLFEGRLVAGPRLVGVLTTKSGTSLPVDFSPH